MVGVALLGIHYSQGHFDVGAAGGAGQCTERA